MRASKRFKENNPVKNGHTEEAKRKISEAGKGRVVSLETRLKKSIALSGEKNPNFGKKASKELREKLSKSQKQHYDNGGAPSKGFLGKEHTKETLDLMSRKALQRERKIFPHCQIECAVNTFVRCHGEKCKKHDR